MDTATADGKEIILLGDLNYDFLRSTSGSDTCSSKQLKLLFRLLNFKQCIVDATRIAQRSASLLDIVVTNTPNNFSCTGVISTGLSDHELVYCVRKINCKKFSVQTKLFRNYAKYNSEAFCSDLDDVDWEQLCNSTRNNMSVNELWSNFKDNFVAVADLHAPLMEKRVRGKACPWLTGEIKKDIRQRNYLLRKAKRSNTTEDWLIYKSHRNRVLKSIKTAKSRYNIKIIKESWR